MKKLWRDTSYKEEVARHAVEAVHEDVHRGGFPWLTPHAADPKINFLTFLGRFGPFLASWRPGTRLKSFLDATRFFSTVYEAVATLKVSNRLNFNVFLTPIARPIFRKPTFFEKVDLILAPSPIHKDENDRKWIL